MTQLICLTIYFLVGYIFYVVVYVKQKEVEKLNREWIRALSVTTLYPLIILISIVVGIFSWSNEWV